VKASPQLAAPTLLFDAGASAALEVMTPEELRAAAGAARRDARRLRAVSAAGRAELGRSKDLSRRWLLTCEATFAWVSRTQDFRYRSAWSDLSWQLPGRELDCVLVAIDGRS
jgi:hypothetical protein